MAYSTFKITNLWGAVSLTAILLITSCSEWRSTPESIESLMVNDGLITAFPFEIMDSSGSNIIFEETPKRIIAYDSDAVEILLALGEGGRLVGTHDFVKNNKELEGVPRLGDAFNIDIERIIELDPDLVYMFYNKDVVKMRELGLKVVYFDSLGRSIDGILWHIRLWGKLIGKTGDAEVIATDFETKLAELMDKLPSNGEKLVVYHHDAEFWSPGGDTLVGSIYRLLGAKLITDSISGYKQLSPEQIVISNPDVIVTNLNAVHEIGSNSKFRGVSAVKNSRIVTPNLDFEVAGPGIIDSIEELMWLLYPEYLEED